MNGFKSYTAYLRNKIENLVSDIVYRIKDAVKDRRRQVVKEPGFGEIISDGENIKTTPLDIKRKKPDLMKKIISLLVTISILSIVILYYFVFKDRVSFTNKDDIYFIINKNSGAYSVANNLCKQRIIRNPLFFKLYVKITGDNNIHSGTFKLKKTMTIPQIMDVLSEKNGPAEMIQFTIPEGFSLEEIKNVLIKNNLISGEDFDAYIKNAVLGTLSFKYPFIDAIPQKNIEGYLYPDTYKVSLGSSLNEIFDIMVGNFDKKIYRYYKANFDKTPKVRGRLMSFHELVTLASIIEKEAVASEERNKIAGVFINRLNKRMYLGSCPTVKYAMGEPRKPTLYFKDLDYDSPYNTYRHLGLPPGPIASPGIESFKAVLNYEKTDYLYFIAKGDGTHYFSKTQKEHDTMRSKLGFNN